MTSADQPPDDVAAVPLTGLAPTDDSTVVVPRSGQIWLGAFVCLLVAANVGSVMLTRLVAEHPGLLLALSSRNRHLVLTVATDLHPAAWATIGASRLLLSAVVCHFLGRAYGDRALRWFWRYLGMSGDQVDRFERSVGKAEWVLVPLFVASNIVWVLTGAARTSWRRLAPLAALGIALRLALVWWLASQFESQLTAVIDFTTEYQTWFILGTLAIVIATQVRNFRGR
jgi:membrane protein DedA with SNARE-associated domain